MPARPAKTTNASPDVPKQAAKTKPASRTESPEQADQQDSRLPIIDAEAATVNFDSSQPTLPAEMVTEAMPDYWVSQINEHLTNGVRSFIEAGRSLISAKAKLEHGDFHSMYKPGRLRICQRTGQMLIRIARNQAITKTNNYALLPPTLNALHALSKMDAIPLQKAIDEGLVYPEMTITAANKLASTLEDLRAEAGSTPADEQDDKPEGLYGELELDASSQLIKTMLDDQFDCCPDQAWKGRLYGKVAELLARHAPEADAAAG